MGIVDDVFGILKVKIKPRQDSYSDQFSRIFLLKLMFVGAFFTGMAWHNDKINCLSVDKVIDDFAKTSCWINGFYIYDEAGVVNNDIGYYGIPRDVDMDGIMADGSLCSVEGEKIYKSQNTCKPMKKRFFLQYQYITFFFVFMGAFYYVPYTFFKLVNTDITSLKTVLKSGGDADQIVNNYFNRGINPSSRLNLRVFGVFATKILYIFANVMVFLLTNIVLNGQYRNYGIDWSTWAELPNAMAYDYMGRRSFPKPGNYLLPSFALCDVYEAAMDVKHKVINKHTMVCELSQHIIYQYILLIIWWAMIVGIIISVAGLIILFVEYLLTLASVKRRDETPSNMQLTLREFEYLEFIRRKNIALFADVMAKLKDQRVDRLVDDRDGLTKEAAF